ncbi:MAG: diguanylate cyclase, partial [Wenzhouxiangellaceae bacterium]
EFVYLEARNLTLDGEPDAALARIERLLDEREMSQRLQLRALRLGANIAAVSRKFEQSFEMLGEALTLLERGDFEGDEVVLALGLYLYTLVGEYELARGYGYEAIESARAVSDIRGLCTANQRLGFLFKRTGEYDQSEAAYRRSIQACMDVGDELSTGVAEAGLADLLRLRREHAAAEALIGQAELRLERTNYVSGLAEAWLYHARLAWDRGQHDEAAELVNRALDWFDEETNWEYLAESHQLLGKVMQARGEADAALAHYDQYMAAREQFLDIDRSRHLAFLEVEFELQRKENQLELASERARVTELELEARKQQVRFTMFAFAMVALVLLTLAYLLVRATRERRRFQSISQRDGLTALSNHTRFFELAERMFLLAGEKHTPFVMVLADIDHFKRINDQYGHLAGDTALRMVGARLREHFGKLGVIGRIGGEEFAIAIPGREVREIERALQRLRASLRETRVDDAPVSITMSFGIAERGPDDVSVAQVRARADRALYQAKRAGRDRVERDGDGQ